MNTSSTKYKYTPNTLNKIHDEVTKISLSLRCPLCLSTLNNPYMLNCLHTFCQGCITKAISENKQCCPVCNMKCTKRSMKHFDQLGSIVTSYHKALRSLGLTPMQYDSSVEMTQLEDEANDMTLLAADEVNAKLEASKMWKKNFEVNKACLVDKQEMVVASNERLLNSASKASCPPTPCSIGETVQEINVNGACLDGEEHPTVSFFQEEHLNPNGISPSNNQFSIGAVVQVESRTWSGVNKPGGVGRITAIHNEGIISYDIKYVLGGQEKNVDASYTSLLEENQNQDSKSTDQPTKRIRTRRSLSGAIAREKENESVFTKRGSSRQRKIPFGESRIALSCHSQSSMSKDNSDDSLVDISSSAFTRYHSLLNQCLEQKHPIYMVLSSINEFVGQQIQTLIDNMKRKKIIIKIQNQLNHQTILCLTIPSGNHPTKSHFRTIKVMRAALFGIPILTPEWIKVCLEQDRIVLPDGNHVITSLQPRIESQNFNEKLHTSVLRYAASNPSKLIFKQQDTYAFLCGIFEKGKGPKKKDILQLLKDCNISILSSPNSLTNTLSLNFSKIIILCDDTEESLSSASITKSLKNYFNQGKRKVFIVSSYWLFDCISYGEELWDEVRYYEPVCRNAKLFWRMTFR